MPPEFAYAPLDQSRDQFRLIELLPAEDPGCPIECRLLHASLGDDIAYEALSYTWADAARPEAMLLDGKPFLITQNLHSALRKLRRPVGERRLLWVDAVCINQDDIVERSYEVLRMRDIYERAARVVIWLGEAGPDSGLAVSHVSLLSDRFEHLVSKRILARVSRFLAWLAEFFATLVKFLFRVLIRKPVIFTFLASLFSNAWEEPRWNLWTPLWTLGKSLAWSTLICVSTWTEIRSQNERKREPDARTVEALKDLFSRPWFSRVWVVQEIAAAREATVRLGPHRLSWRQLSNAYQWLHAAVSVSYCGTIYVDARFQRLNELMRAISRRASGCWTFSAGCATSRRRTTTTGSTGSSAYATTFAT